jgi:hypothetical protein
LKFGIYGILHTAIYGVLPLIGNDLGTPWQADQKRLSAALRYKPHRSTYFRIRLALRFFARLTSKHFLISLPNGVFFKTLPDPGLNLSAGCVSYPDFAGMNRGSRAGKRRAGKGKGRKRSKEMS